MSNIDKQALRNSVGMAARYGLRIKLDPSSVLALLDELEAKEKYAKDRDAENEDLMLTVGRLRVEREATSENERMAKSLADRNGEPVEGLVKRVAELEEIATDYGMKFQRAQDALKHQSLLHKSQMEDKDKQIADLKEAFRIALSAAGIDVANGSAKGE